MPKAAAFMRAISRRKGAVSTAITRLWAARATVSPPIPQHKSTTESQPAKRVAR